MKTIEEKMTELMDLKAWNKEHNTFKDLELEKRKYKTLRRALIPETKTMANQPDKIIVVDLIEFQDNKERRFLFRYWIRYGTGTINVGGTGLSVTKDDWIHLLTQALNEEIDLPDRADVRFIKEKYRNELVQKLEQRNFQQLSDDEINYLIGCLVFRWNFYS